MSDYKFGLSADQWQILQEKLIDPLTVHHCEIWVFGSRATGTHRPFSDIDILYKSNQSIPDHLIGTIQEDLEHSQLPIKVDLVSDDDLAESYRGNVEKQKIQI